MKDLGISKCHRHDVLAKNVQYQKSKQTHTQTCSTRLHMLYTATHALHGTNMLYTATHALHGTNMLYTATHALHGTNMLYTASMITVLYSCMQVCVYIYMHKSSLHGNCYSLSLTHSLTDPEPSIYTHIPCIASMIILQGLSFFLEYTNVTTSLSSGMTSCCMCACI